MTGINEMISNAANKAATEALEKMESENVSDNKKKSMGEIINSMNEVELSGSNEEAVLFLYGDKSGDCLFCVDGFMPSFRNIIKNPPINKTNTKEVLSLRAEFLNIIIGLASIICNENKERKELLLELQKC